MTLTVLHVARAFSAQPTLWEYLADAVGGGDPDAESDDAVTVVEAPLPEALAPNHLHPDVVWISSAGPDGVDAVRRRYPAARILATPAAGASGDDVVRLISRADLVLRDEGVVLAAAGVHVLARRRAPSVR